MLTHFPPISCCYKYQVPDFQGSEKKKIPIEKVSIHAQVLLLQLKKERQVGSICKWFFFWLFLFLWATPAAYGGSQARGPIGAVPTSLCQSHSNAGSEPRLQPTPQLTATPDRQPTEQGQGPNPQPHGS